MQPIVISEVSVSLEEFERLNQQLTGRRRLLILVLLPLTFFFFLLQDAVFGDAALPSPLVLGGAVLFVVVIVALLLRRFKAAVRQVYTSHQTFLAPTTYILSEEGISVFSATVNSQVQWSAFRRAVALDGWWHLQTSSGGYFLAASRVQPPATPADVTALLRQRGLLR